MHIEYQRLFNFFESEMQLTAKLKAEIVKENEIKNEIERKLADLEEKCTMKGENQAKKL